MIIGYYLLLLGFALNGLVLLGIRNERERLKRDYLDAIRQHRIVRIGRR